MSPFNYSYLTQNYNSKYVEISSGKTYRSNQWRHLMFVKWKYTTHEKIGVKVDRFLKIVRKISNLSKSRRLIYKNTKLSSQWFWTICHMDWMFSKQVVTDPGCEQWVHTSYCSPNKVREMVTHLGTQMVKRITPMYAPCC